MPGASGGRLEMHRGKGATNRVILARKPTMSAAGWVLPSNSVKAMDISRNHVVAYEYLSHVAECVRLPHSSSESANSIHRAQAWLDSELRRDPAYDADAPEADLTTGGVVEFEQALRNGVALAKLARVFDGKEAVPRIYTVRLVTLFLKKGIALNVRGWTAPQAGVRAYRQHQLLFQFCQEAWFTRGQLRIPVCGLLLI